MRTTMAPHVAARPLDHYGPVCRLHSCPRMWDHNGPAYIAISCLGAE